MLIARVLEQAHTSRTMQHAIEMMETALRVLKAILEKHDPAPADVAELRRLAPSLSDAPLDELACDVIQRALKGREAARAAVSRKRF